MNMNEISDRETILQWKNFLSSRAGLRYLAKRVIAGARHEVKERIKLDAWLEKRMIFNRHLDEPNR